MTEAQRKRAFEWSRRRRWLRTRPHFIVRKACMTLHRVEVWLEERDL